MAEIVLDASALLAMIQGEPGGNRVARLLVDPKQSALVSAVNWSEVFDRLMRSGVAEKTAEQLLGRLGIKIVDFDRRQARLAAVYRITMPALSLADRACLALATLHKAKAWTTDRIWARLKSPVALEILR